MEMHTSSISLICITVFSFSTLLGVSTAGRKSITTLKATETSWQKKFKALKLQYDKREEILNKLMEQRFGKKKTAKIMQEAGSESNNVTKEADIAQLRIFLGQQLPGKKLGKASKYNQLVNQVAFELEKVQDAKDIDNIKHTILTFYNQALAKLTNKRHAAFTSLQGAMIRLKFIDVKTLYPTYIAKVKAIIRQKANDNNVNLLKQLIEKLPDEEINKIGKFKIFQYIKKIQKNSKLALLPTTQELIQVAQKKGIMPK